MTLWRKKEEKKKKGVRMYTKETNHVSVIHLSFSLKLELKRFVAWLSFLYYIVFITVSVTKYFSYKN